MAKKIFVGGLNWNTDDQGLRQSFEKFGTVQDAKVITDRESGRSRGFGFVTFIENESADTAIAQMDGNELEGRRIKVNEAFEKGQRDGNRGR